jgi:hypothetical protein
MAVESPQPAAAESPAPASRAPQIVRMAALLGLLALVGVYAWGGIRQLTVADRAQDFEYFYQAGAWLLERGVHDPGYDVRDGRVVPRGRLDWYLPFVARFMTLFAWLPFLVAGVAWVGLNVVLVVATLRLLGRAVSGLPPDDWPVTQLLTLVLLATYWRWEFRLNQIDILTLALLVGAFVSWRRGAPLAGGLWAGLAVLLKVTPALVVLWFAAKRQWRVVAAAVVTIVLAGPVADVVVFGPADAAAQYQGWLRRAVTEGSHGGLIRAQREMDWRNQALGAVLARWLHPTNMATKFDNDPRMQAAFDEDAVQTMNVANLSREQVALVVQGIALVSLVAVAWLVRRRAGSCDATRLRVEWALVLVLMLWLMPVMRRYHMIWMTPALTVIGSEMARRGWRAPWTWLAAVALAGVVGAQVAALWRPLEAAGIPLLSVLLLGIALIAALPGHAPAVRSERMVARDSS